MDIFCSEAIFNFSHRMLTDIEIKNLEKGLDFAPIQRKMNGSELTRDFNKFCRRMRLKKHLMKHQLSRLNHNIHLRDMLF